MYNRLLFNALIQLHFDYGCNSFDYGSNEKFRSQTINKCIRFCLNLPPRFQIDLFYFIKRNWPPPSDRVEYCIANTIFKCWNGTVPGFIHEMFKPSLCRFSTRSQMAFDIPLRKTNTGQKGLYFLRPKIGSK